MPVHMKVALNVKKVVKSTEDAKKAVMAAEVAKKAVKAAAFVKQAALNLKNSRKVLQGCKEGCQTPVHMFVEAIVKILASKMTFCRLQIPNRSKFQ